MTGVQTCALPICSSKIICEYKKFKDLHLFDTFEGLPELTDKDNPNHFKKGQYPALLEDVKRYLKSYENVYFYKGLFNDRKMMINYERFSLVHLDVDLYEPTKECLEFFYDKVNKGGIIISHDYNSTKGVKKA